MNVNYYVTLEIITPANMELQSSDMRRRVVWWVNIITSIY